MVLLASWFAEAFAGRVMGRVEETPEYVRGRKHTVFRAALEGAVEDGVISGREREILARLRGELEIPRETASRLEEEVLAQEGLRG